MSDDDNARTERRRGWLVVGGAAAAVAVLALAVALVRPGGDEPEGGFTTGPEVPATSRALVAVALTHLDVEPSFYESLDRPDLDFGKGTLGGHIRHGGDDMSSSDGLLVSVTPTTKSPPSCTEWVECVVTPTDQGKLTTIWQEEEPEEDPGFVAVTLQREDELAWVQQSDEAVTGDPRKQDLKVSVDEMIAIVEDPEFSLVTRQAAVDAGEKLSPWKGEKPASEPPAPDAKPWTLRVLAVIADEHVDRSTKFSESDFVEPRGPAGRGRGVHVEWGKTSYDVLVVEEPDHPDAIACPVDWECADGDGVTYAWKGHDGAILRDRGDFVVRVWVTDNETVMSKDEFFEYSLAGLDNLTTDERISLLMNPQLIRKGEEFRFWKDR